MNQQIHTFNFYFKGAKGETMLTKKHYKKIAQILCNVESHANLDGQQMNIILTEFCTYFEEDNPRFDRVKFIDAALGARDYEIPNSD